MSEDVVAPDCSITSGATACNQHHTGVKYFLKELTPIRTPNYRIIIDCTSRLASNTEVRELYTTILIGEDICTFDIPMYDALLVEVDKPFQDLRYIHSHEIFRKLSKFFANAMERTVLAEPALYVSLCSGPENRARTLKLYTEIPES